jgi:hypothetical protein
MQYGGKDNRYSNRKARVWEDHHATYKTERTAIPYDSGRQTAPSAKRDVHFAEHEDRYYGVVSSDKDDSGIGAKVSFYFANIPDYMPLFRLRQFFEVCGILSDIYVARHLNARGQVYGFVRYSNVKNRDKLGQALNNIWIGDYRVWARVARFDRFAQFDADVKVERSGGREVGRVEEVRPVVITHGVGIKNVRMGKTVVEELGCEGEKIVKVGTVDVNVEQKEKKK